MSAAPKTRPIVLRDWEARELAEGRLRQLRRVVKPQPDKILDLSPYWNVGGYRTLPSSRNPLRCPLGAPGDLLWVRETFAHRKAEYEWSVSTLHPALPEATWYAADGDVVAEAEWQSPVRMPQSLSRHTLRVTDVRVERVQDITEADARAAGITYADAMEMQDSYPAAFRALWHTLHASYGPHGWDANPWVWVVGVEKVEER